jgi:arylsulfatase A-like enzyme
MMKSPNVIFIITDDQGYGDLAYQGNPVLKTPNLDQMAHESVQLDNHHHDPLCSPSRAALMTGFYASRSGVWHVIHGRHLLDRNTRTMGNIFADNGYQTGMFGKWHLGDNYPYAPQYRGFQEVVCHRGGGVGELPDYWDNNYVDDTYFHNGVAEKYDGYCTDIFFDEAMKFIEARKEQPFFVYLATNAMHSPFIVPEEYATPYLEQGLPENRANFYGMIANFDENMGRLFAHLSHLGLDDNTIVIFTADHGTAAGYDPTTGDGYNAGMRGKKGSVYDGGHRVNFFLRWQNTLEPEKKISELSAHIDILPTVLELCNLDCEVDFDGISLAPHLQENAPSFPERSIFAHLQPDEPIKWHHCVVMNDCWRLVDGEELYDIETDLSQESDIAKHNPQVVAKLRKDYDAWWDSLVPIFEQYSYIPIGTEYENPTLLSARDWHPTEGRIPWMQTWIGDPAYDAEGFWAIEISRDGIYEISLRRYPIEANLPLASSQARLKIADFDEIVSVDETASEVVFTVNLEQGMTTLQSWLMDDLDRTWGAYYVYVHRV